MSAPVSCMKNRVKSKGGDLVERSKVIACILTLLLATALFAVSARAQSLTSGEAKTAATEEPDYSYEEDAVIHPLKPGDTFSSPREMLRSFLLNMNGDKRDILYSSCQAKKLMFFY